MERVSSKLTGMFLSKVTQSSDGQSDFLEPLEVWEMCEPSSDG